MYMRMYRNVPARPSRLGELAPRVIGARDVGDFAGQYRSLKVNLWRSGRLLGTVQLGPTDLPRRRRLEKKYKHVAEQPDFA